MKILTTLPFTGFYESLHSNNLQREFDSIFENDSGYIESKFERAENALHGVLDWRKAYESYAKLYSDSLDAKIQEWLGVNSSVIQFESLQSPQFYNYSTDRIFAYVDSETLATMFRQTPRKLLTEMIADKFTSRDGFQSSYSESLVEWNLESRLASEESRQGSKRNPAGSVDHNEAGTILEAWLIAAYHFDQAPSPDLIVPFEKASDSLQEWLDLWLMEDSSGNGELQNIIWAALPARAHKLANFANSLARGEN